ncbi:alanine racemase [Paenibacillus yonginensis]|uniref:Alanine racemase n=2 Tax=Paenibacillus yonginensis TaxID=1462996 RepID=A0A1B1N6S7_9BACL|nr:alanine racemase [Paenibacillus yonginensis]
MSTAAVPAGATPTFYRDTWVEVDLDHIAWNIAQIRKQLPEETAFIAVVKANAYGHGDVQVAAAALEAGASYLAVACLDEALALRDKGITAPILVLGATRPVDVSLAAARGITLTIFQKQWVNDARMHLHDKDRLKVHVKVDTGMGRIGIRSSEELTEIEGLIQADDRLEWEGIYTHFSTADEPDTAYFERQLGLFQEMLGRLTRQPEMIHCSNSAAALRFPKARFNAVRVGLAMYGVTPSDAVKDEAQLPLKEAFSLRTKLIHVKKLPKGEKVGYGATYETEEEEWIGTLPIGYADGWIRRLQGQEVLVDGVRAPIVGRICMDQCMIRLPAQAAVGTTVTLIGHADTSFIPVDEIAEKLETIAYEVLCLIGSRVPRIYKRTLLA